MDYFNLMEVIVSDMVDQVLEKDRSISGVGFTRSDIIAYILNRVPARYVTGERGMMHSRIDTRLKFQQHSDLLFLIYEAVDIFSKRRGADADRNIDEIEWRSGIIPHIMGEVLEESTLSIVPEVKISLLYNNIPVPMVDSNWENPYTTRNATRGYYHFWPYIDGNAGDIPDSVKFTITFEHPDFEVRRIDIAVPANKKRGMGKNFNVPITLLKLKPGKSPEFLCQD
jgi:hypothetical protein